MIPRILARYLLRDAEVYPVVTLTGPRQSGKNTLARATFPDHEYVSLEPVDRRSHAVDDPRGFLTSLSGPAVLDEVQRAPELFSYIQSAVDEDPSPGRFILSGSQNFLLHRSISQSLAGRAAVRHLLPFSRAELEGTPQGEPAGGTGLFDNLHTSLDLWEAVRTGFYPRIHDVGIEPEIWLYDYVQTYLERDVRSLANIGDLTTVERFLALCAGRTGQILNYTSLAADCGVSVDTAKRWISVLKASFAIFLLRPHHRNFNKRIRKSPKLFFHDTGLACHLLGIRTKEQLVTHPARGALFENFVVAEVQKAWVHHRREAPIYYWRDRTGHEVDLLIDDAGSLYPVEIKSGQTVAKDMLKGLLWWSKQADQSPASATLVHGGTDRYTREEIAVRPWFSI